MYKISKKMSNSSRFQITCKHEKILKLTMMRNPSKCYSYIQTGKCSMFLMSKYNLEMCFCFMKRNI